MSRNLDRSRRAGAECAPPRRSRSPRRRRPCPRCGPLPPLGPRTVMDEARGTMSGSLRAPGAVPPVGRSRTRSRRRAVLESERARGDEAAREEERRGPGRGARWGGSTSSYRGSIPRRPRRSNGYRRRVEDPRRVGGGARDSGRFMPRGSDAVGGRAPALAAQFLVRRFFAELACVGRGGVDRGWFSRTFVARVRLQAAGSRAPVRVTPALARGDSIGSRCKPTGCRPDGARAMPSTPPGGGASSERRGPSDVARAHRRRDRSESRGRPQAARPSPERVTPCPWCSGSRAGRPCGAGGRWRSSGRSVPGRRTACRRGAR